MIQRTMCRAASLAAIAAALAVTPAAAEEEVGDSQKQIVVTGTHIRGSAEDAPAPVEVISGGDLLDQGSPTMMGLAKALAVSSGVLGDAAQFDTRSQFNQGAASVNLRGLGPQRTLVLLNGKRVVATGAGNLPLVDVNLIPSAALDRIEILKDGAAATYGSDAIAGVVNFITRTDQQGFLAAGDYRYVEGSSGDWTGALSWGGEVGGARLFLSGGYQRRGELRSTDRDYGMLPFELNPQGGYSGGGNPGNFDFDATLNGIRFDADEGCTGVGGFRSLPGSAADLCMTNYLGITDFVEPEERFQLFADVELPLGAADLRLTGLYGRTETVLTTSPSYLPTIAPSANAAFGGSGLFVIPQYAPALIDYCARFASSGCSVGADGNPQAPALAYPVRFRPALLGGNPLFDNDRHAAVLPYTGEQYQLAATLELPVTDAIDLAASVTWSKNDRHFQGGDSFVDLLQNALAGFGGESCAYATPQSRAGLTPVQLAALAGTGGCHFFNPFSTAIAGNTVTGQANPNYAGTSNPFGFDLTPGAGLINDASTFDDFYTIIDRTATTEQWVADLAFSGGTGWQLGGGEASFALGAQYRDDGYRRTYGATNNLDVYPCPGSILNPAATCNPETGPIGFLGSNRDADVSSDVWSLFAELQLPVTDRLQAQLSARYEDYGSIGSTFDPQLRVKYQVADWLALRGGAGTTFRGPPPQNTAADLVILTFIGGAFRAVDILANPDLEPETATTWNGGVLVDAGGFKASADYWRYEFAGAIEAEPVSGIVSALFGSTGTAHCGDPAYAGLQARFTFSGGICSAANVQRLATFAFNSADVTTSGLDFKASYDFAAGSGMVQAGFAGTHVFDYKVGDVVVEGITVQPAFDAAGKLNYQTTAYPIPQWKGQAWLQGAFGGHLVRLQANHIAGYDDQRGADVFGPNNGALAGAAVTTGQHIKAFTTFDAIWRWNPFGGTTVAVALENLFDEDPPFARLDQNFDPFTANPLGFTAKFGVSQSF